MDVGDEDFWYMQIVVIYALFWCKNEQNSKNLRYKYSGTFKAFLEWKIHLNELIWLQGKCIIIFCRIKL